MQLDEFWKEIVHHLRHEHAVAEIARDVLLRPVERNGVDPAVEMRQRGGVELGHGGGQRAAGGGCREAGVGRIDGGGWGGERD